MICLWGFSISHRKTKATHADYNVVCVCVCAFEHMRICNVCVEAVMDELP